MLLKIANFHVRLFKKNSYRQKVHTKLPIRHYNGFPGFSSGFLVIAALKLK